MTLLTRFIARVYALLLRLYPREFREQFGDEMQVTFADAMTEASNRGNRARLQFALRDLFELIPAIVQEHFQRKNMAWLNQHMNVLRGIEFALLLVALIGPWWFDRIVVPAQYPCSAPVVRLEGDFCGVPMSGTSILWMGILGPFNIIAELIAGAALADRIREFVLGLFLLPALPLISLVPMILARYRRRYRVFHIIALGLAGGFALFANLPNLASPRFWALWGLWLYTGTAVGALMLEILTLNQPKEPIDAHSFAASSK